MYKKFGFFSFLFSFLSFFQMGVGEDGGGGSDGGDGGNGGSDNGDSGNPADGGTDKGADGDKDKPKISDAEAKLLKEVMDKKTALNQSKEQIKELQGQLKRFEGIDPDAVRQLLKEREDAENKKLEDKGEFERLKQKMADAHAQEIAAKVAEAEDLRAKLQASQSKISELTVGSAFSQSEFIREELAMTPSKTRIVYGTHFEFNDEGQLVAYDRPAGDKNRAPLVDGAGNPLAFDEALRKIVEADPDRDALIKSKVKTGADSKTDTKSKTVDPKKDATVSGRDKIAAGLAAALKK